MFKFKLVIFLVFFLSVNCVWAVENRENLILGVALGTAFLGVALIFAEQIETHWMEIAVSTAVTTFLYLVIDRQWYLEFDWIPPEPRPAIVRNPIVLPPRITNHKLSHAGHSGRKLADMARFPVSVSHPK